MADYCPSTVYALAHARASVFKHLFGYMTETNSPEQIFLIDVITNFLQ